MVLAVCKVVPVHGDLATGSLDFEPPVVLREGETALFALKGTPIWRVTPPARPGDEVVISGPLALSLD